MDIMGSLHSWVLLGQYNRKAVLEVGNLGLHPKVPQEQKFDNIWGIGNLSQEKEAAAEQEQPSVGATSAMVQFASKLTEASPSFLHNRNNPPDHSWDKANQHYEDLSSVPGVASNGGR
eukprot:6475594-Amphidinium_carterae.1